ncbi:MAG: hypothetical protein EB060_10405 [Proteobacteria bacterium]|nr:hypothetical protein [Pseudomonadota bacterium]
MKMIVKEDEWFSISDTGITFNREFTEDEWNELGNELARNSKSLMWMIGDWLIAGADPSRQYLPRRRMMPR